MITANETKILAVLDDLEEASSLDDVVSKLTMSRGRVGSLLFGLSHSGLAMRRSVGNIEFQLCHRHMPGWKSFTPQHVTHTYQISPAGMCALDGAQP